MISTVKLLFLRSRKPLIPPLKRKKAYLRVSEDRKRMPWGTESVDSSVVLVSPQRFATVGKIFSKDIPHLVMRDEIFTAFHLIFLSQITSNNAALRLHFWSHVDTWQKFRIMIEDIIVTCSLGDKNHTLTLNLPLRCIYFLDRQESMGPVSVSQIWTREEVPWWPHPSLLP